MENGQTPQLAFQGPRARGYYTQFKQWPITPLSSNIYWQPDSIIRFLVNITQGVMDPYRSHLEVTIQTDAQLLPVGQLQVDSSAQGFISQSVVSSNQVQIQRITQYDTLACYLTDIGFSQYVCQSREVEGIGYSNIPTHQPYSTYTNISTNSFFQNPINATKQQGIIQYCSSFQTKPSKVQAYSGIGSRASMEQPTGYPNILAANQATSDLSYSNYLIHPYQDLSVLPQHFRPPNYVAYAGHAINMRAQYLDGYSERNYPDVNTSFLQNAPVVKGQQWTYDTMLTKGFNPKKPYFTQIPSENFMIPDGSTLLPHVHNICSLNGYQKPICPQFCRGTNESTISATVATCQMRDGKILRQKVPSIKKTYRIPLISAICGLLIPPDQFLLIPLQAMNNLLLQLTLSPFAMFTSGYNDVHQYDTNGMAFMQRRNYKLSQVAWNIHMYTFNDQAANRSIQQKLYKEIIISSSLFQLSSQFQIPNGGVVRNSWPIGSQSESLNEVIMLFLSNQYQTKTFCRKQFRLSNNITSMQIRANTQFYPTQPIVGNAGNPQSLDPSGDNWPFYELLLLSNNFLFNTNIPMPKINQKNFAINSRCYDVDNKNTYYAQGSYKNPAYLWHQQSVNMDTALGYSAFHQNRYVGKAAYVWTWEPYGHSKQLLSGLDTTGIRQFDATFNTSPNNQFPKDQTLYIFTKSNVLVIYSPKGIKVVGK